MAAFQYSVAAAAALECTVMSDLLMNRFPEMNLCFEIK